MPVMMKLQKQQEEKKSNSKKDSTDKNKTEGSDDMEEDEVEKLESTAAFLSIEKKMEHWTVIWVFPIIC